MLGSTQPSSRGDQVPITTIQRMAGSGNIRLARMLDYDNRVVVADPAGREFWASYPSNGVVQDQLIGTIRQSGRAVVIDAQSGKQAKRLIVQVLLPILILASLFALCMRISQKSDAGGMGAFSRWAGRRSKLGPGSPGG